MCQVKTITNKYYSVHIFIYLEKSYFEKNADNEESGFGTSDSFFSISFQ